MAKSISPQESKTLGLLKFSLIFLVIYGHMIPETISIKDASFPLLSGHGISNAIAIAISYVHITIPIYFLISGYFFWMDIEGWKWDVFLQKLKNRSKTLLLPYVLWNVISIGSFVALLFFQDIRNDTSFTNIAEYLNEIGIRGFWDYHVWGENKTNWLGQSIPQSSPFIVPLWFLRDLMVVVLFTPALYWLLKKTGIWGLLLLMFCYISKIWPQVHGFSIDAFFFFGLGLYISINKKTLIDIAQKYKISSLIISTIAFVIAVYYGGIKTAEGRLVFPIFTIFGTWVYINIANYIVNRDNYHLPSLLAKSTFFIFLLHACPFANYGSIISNVNTIIISIVNRISAPWILYYLISPFITVACCLLVFYILQRWMPGLCQMLTGNRKPTSQRVKEK